MKGFFGFIKILLFSAIVVFALITCKEPATCSSKTKEQCDWDEWVITITANCTTTGFKFRNCNNDGCEKIYEQKIPIDPNNHVWGNYIQTIQPTCENDGVMTRTCTYITCDAVYSVTQKGDNALEHNFSNWGTLIRIPTVSQNGEQEGTCINCTTSTTRIVQWEVTTLAGDGTAGITDGLGTAARFFHPSALTIASNGNIYIADTNNHRIRMMTPSGLVSTLTGSASGALGGFDNGQITIATFRQPFGIVIDSFNNIYVADSMNYSVRRITPDGIVSTFAGDGTSGFANGLGTAAKFNFPFGIALDSIGNIFIADITNHRIRKITSDGVVTTYAGTGAQGAENGNAITQATFNQPVGVAVDSQGNVYVADQSNHRIRKIDSLGNVSTLAGDGTSAFADGQGTAARFASPGSVAVDSAGNIYVGDVQNHRIRMITPSGNAFTLAGDGTYAFADGLGPVTKFWNPYGIAVDSDGNIYVADSGNQRIRKMIIVPVVQ